MTKPKFLNNDFQRIFVTDRYVRNYWGNDKFAIKGNCDTSVPFKNYANKIYKYPENPSYIPYPKPKRGFVCEKADPIEEPVLNESNISLYEDIADNSTTSTQLLIFETPNRKVLSNLTLGLIIAAIVELILLLVMISYIIIKSNSSEESSDSDVIEMKEEEIQHISNQMTFVHENVLFNMNTTMSDDPFAQDFEDVQDDNYAFNTDLIVDDE
ncbi:hypothetical protein TVAG_109310 [Trichomonas vaginalis G3]|uniref:Uncharacterized protein n=1 Tax=Trichomonas vaginalis (strain ATCC PRA-98 / G3) TaxID=412133 RepID=A2EAC0_TRIV3|nr:hypothetical protein TVAGG3_0924550 [Trichomonas vaginalis G3]EAY10347.1 hypothetical protein TVAG_109310 [Trichomonas vaginalis G3]KAI5485370.1 hypothetical protein TVAGG3_0924550 [Trichomonas vaginalis G3]|eukprot:XP_001322570.1 hypothetical protein [Trichomonas vaginalis G3]